MKIFIALTVLSCLVFSTTTYASQLKSIPVEDQGPGKDGKGSKQNDGKDKKETSKKVN
ncbi:MULTISPECIES: hypothetical protein [Halobacteriovorax]|uniref:hypothetical protein n=1 Tax=Halobacteriovorax TaxID=1652133 RepID=UPI000EB70652|nr:MULTISPECIES: hypothetical protein [Halobacteriovorax]AYF45305.1 hypothetical protein BALOs_2307 [Halobacteriovorax sp. BALOs_7]